MAFITTEDYTALIRNEIKAILLEDYSDTKLNAAEQMAISQVKNYLAGKYDIEAIFTATGEARNKHIVMIVLDCTLYHLYTSVARKKMPDTRANRYQDAIDWLKAEKSATTPSADLPRIKDENGEELQGIKITSKYRPSNQRW
ncbi:phage protein Gp36 family protein [Tenacibaculum sp. SSH1-16]|uniref:phage protein Gp36 family protein n=1 Tax=Tenacibaculum sp. SSH1-16 TaxID=3136667 RepID=UPI0032C3E994